MLVTQATANLQTNLATYPNSARVNPLDQPKQFNVDDVVAKLGTRRRVKRGEYLYRFGGDFHALYAVRCGSFKTMVLTEDGREQVTGFYMVGEMLGLDAISSEAYAGDAVALEDSEIVEIPFVDLEAFSRRDVRLQSQIYRLLSQEILRDRSLMLMLGSMRAEERVAAFLLNLSQRLGNRGFSPTRFLLRMTRDEIGSLLGLKLETVSRIFSRFQAEGLLSVHNRDVRINDAASLRGVIGRSEATH